MKKNKFCFIMIMIFSISISACTYRQSKDGEKELEKISTDDVLPDDDYTEEEIQASREEVKSTEEEISIEERISNTLKRYVNTRVWLEGERTSEYDLLNKEVNYEYYSKTVLDTTVGSEGYYDYIAVLLMEPIQTWPRIEKLQYHIFMKPKDSWDGNDIDDYGRRYRDTVDECRDFLKEEGYTKLGEGSITFEEVKEPDYGEDSEEKLEIVLDIARSFMIGKPEEITELYILNFHIFSDYTEILYVFDDEYWETEFQLGGSYNKPFSVSEFDEDGYYRSQFMKIAYKVDVTDIENSQIISLPGGQ